MVSVPVIVEMGPPMEGRGDVPVRAWITRKARGIVYVSAQLQNGQILGIGHATDYFVTGKELEEIAKL